MDIEQLILEPCIKKVTNEKVVCIIGIYVNQVTTIQFFRIILLKIFF